jgi:ABC-type uncharacterized transport system permease subunit
MLSRIILSILKLSFKNHFLSKFTIIAEVFSVFITLIIYWFTSQAFGSAVDSHLSKWGGSYFDYLIIGEVFLILPTYFVQQFCEQIKYSMINQTLDTLLDLPIPPFKSIFTIGLLGLSSTISHIFIMLAMSLIFFNFSLPLHALLPLIIIQIISLMSFIGLGFIGVSLLMITGRGQGVINYFCLFGSFFSGAFFPLSVLPSFFSNWAHYFSPFSTLMIYTRQIILEPTNTGYILDCLFIQLPMGLVLLSLGTLCLRASIKKWRTLDSKILFTRV